MEIDRKRLQSQEKLRRHLLNASVALYFLSFILPAYVTVSGQSQHVHYGIEALLFGPLGVFAGHFSWPANLLLWFSWEAHGKGNSMKPFVLGLLATAVALTFLLHRAIAVGSAGEYEFYASYGFYSWLASMVIAAVAGWNDSDILVRDEVAP